MAQLRVLGPPEGVRQRRAAHAPLPPGRQRRPPALEPARPLLRAPDQGAGAAPAARQAPRHRAGAAVQRGRLPAGGEGRGGLAADAAARPAHDRREGGRRAARRAARAAQPAAPARGHGQDAHRARVDRRLPRVRRAAGGVRRAHRDPEGARMERFPDAVHILGSDIRDQAPGGGRRLPDRGRAAAHRLLDARRVAGHHAHARVERGVRGARLDARPPRPGRGPPAPHRPGPRRDRLVPAGARDDRRDDGRRCWSASAR